MPYKRRYYKKRVPKKKSFLQKALPVAQKAFKIAKFVAGAINPEYKYNLASASLIVPTWNGSVTTLVDPTQGSGATQRTGDSIRMKDLVLRLVLDYNTLGVAEMVRFIIFIDKQNVITTASQLLQTTGVYLSTESEKNEDNKYLTKVLLDKTIMVSANKPQSKFKWLYQFKKPFHTHYTAGTATITNNAIKLCVISQNPTYSAKYSYIMRSSYLDN